MSTIELRGVAKDFGATRVLRDVDLVVPDGSTTAVLGASGSGKTTLLRLIAGFEHVDAGTVAIDGRVVDDGIRSVRAQHRGVGYVPQEGALFPHLTVLGNVGFGIPRSERARATKLIEMVGLEGLAGRYPHQLSGGQQQRVALARALVIRPSVVLLDEPFGSLDASLRTGLRRDVARVLAETHTTTVLVTHDQNEALAFADRIAVLRHGLMVVSADPHELYRDPPDVTAATSIGEANILPATVSADRANCVLGVVPLHAHGPVPAGPVQLLLRPEQLVLHRHSVDGMVRAVVVDAQFHGHDTLVDLLVEYPRHQALLARVPGDLVLTPGQPVWVEVAGQGRVWALDGKATGHRARPALGSGTHGRHGSMPGTDDSLWVGRNAGVRPTRHGGPVPGATGGHDRGDPAPRGPRPGPGTPTVPPPRRRSRTWAAVMVLAGVALIAFLILHRGSSASAVGPVVFHADISVTGEITANESFTDKTTAAKNVASCAQAGADGDRPSLGPHTWVVPTPPINNTVEIEIGTPARGYDGPGRYPQSVLAKGNGAMDVGPESYDLTSPDATASMTVNGNGSGNVTFTHVPGDDDNPHAGWHGGISGTIAWTCTS